MTSEVFVAHVEVADEAEDKRLVLGEVEYPLVVFDPFAAFDDDGAIDADGNSPFLEPIGACGFVDEVVGFGPGDALGS